MISNVFFIGYELLNSLFTFSFYLSLKPVFLRTGYQENTHDTYSLVKIK